MQDLLRAIRRQALVDVHRGTDPGYVLRYVFRWYSEKFHTPLHEVDDLPMEDVFRAFYEVRYEEMKAAEPKHDGTGWEDEIRRGLLTEQEARDERWNEDRREADDLAFLEQVAKENKTAAEVVKATERIGLAAKALADAASALAPEELPAEEDIRFDEPVTPTAHGLRLFE